MSHSEIQFERLAVVGVGLIGGSVACAAKAAGIVNRVIGYGRNRARLEDALRLGVINDVATEPDEIADADLIVVCTPVDRIAADVCDLLGITSSQTIITDVGSIKGAVVHHVERHSAAAERFLGSHPLAGSHLTGFENSDPQLFAHRLCVLTPSSGHSTEMIVKLRQFWAGLGMRVVTTSAEEHDRILACTSHLPHLAASAVAAIVEEKFLEFASTGYRDTTRVAAGDPELWTAIFSQNSEQVVRVTDELVDWLQRFRKALTADRHEEVKALLKVGQDRRNAFRDRDEGSMAE